MEKETGTTSSKVLEPVGSKPITAADAEKVMKGYQKNFTVSDVEKLAYGGPVPGARVPENKKG